MESETVRKESAMSEQATFKAERRTTLGKGVKRLRREGIAPGNIYGDGPSIPVQFDVHAFGQFLKKHEATAVFRLDLGDGARQANVMVARVQHEPVTGAIQHVDFLQVQMSKPVRARVPIHIEGEAPAVKLHDAVLLHMLDTVEVEARPGDLPAALDLDISGLADLKSALRVGDVAAPPRVKILTDSAETVVKIEPSKLTFIEEAAEAPASVPMPPAGEETQAES